MRYGNWGRHLELFEMFEDAREDPEQLLGLMSESEQERYEAVLQEGSGAPEGRVDFPFFLQTVIRNRVRERFATVASKWDQYVGIESAQDFREHTVTQLGSIRGYEGVQEFGEYKRLRSTEEGGPSYAVGKYGGIYGVTYELIINDDPGVILNRIPRELGKSMAEYVSQAVVALIESNPTYSVDSAPFFSAGRGNEVTGSAADISGDNLVAIIDSMVLRRDGDNIPINHKPTRLLVRNPSQKFKFDQIIKSQQTGVRMDISGSGASGVDFAPGTDNPIQNILPADATIIEPWLNDPNDWYVLADADNRPPFIACFLRGQRDPYIFQKDSGMRGVGGGGTDPYEMEVDEIPFKVRHVFGAAAGEPLAAFRARPS